MIDEIVLRRKNKLTIPKITICEDGNDRAVLTIMKNIENLGFTFGEDVFSVVRRYDVDNIEVFYRSLIPLLKKMCGADVEYTPMYPNFPQQVIDADDIELFINAIVHYWSYGQLLPEYKKDERLPLMDSPALTVLTLGTQDDRWDIFANLLSSKTSISDEDKEDIKTIIREEGYVTVFNHLPDEIPMKENVAFLCKTILEESDPKDCKALQKYFKTATDVLRLVISMSDGDISLATNTKFKKLNRKERRFIMNLLVGCGKYIEEDMFKYKDRWIRVGEIIHPREFRQTKYGTVVAAFSSIRHGVKPTFISTNIQENIKNGKIEEAVKLLELRPGEFARQLDKLLRDAPNTNYVINSFAKVADKVSTTVLLNVRQHFIDRGNDNEVRIVMPKGSVAKAYAIPKIEGSIDKKVCASIITICEQAIIEEYCRKEFLGNVYVDEDFKNYVAPFSQRSASTANKTLVRGSRVKIDDSTNTVRGFIWWTNPKKGYRTDIDLSVSLFDSNWEYLSRVDWTALKNTQLGVYHSGDIIDGGDFNGKGVTECIDIDMDKAIAGGVRYAVFTVHGYTDTPFSECEHLRFGWMNREEANSGEIFDPSTVEMFMDVNAESRMAIPVIFDLIERQFIWCDLVLAGGLNEQYRGNTIEGNLTGAKAACYAITNIRKPSLYDVIKLNVAARGKVVSEREKADIIFSNDTTKPVIRTEDEDGNIVETVKDVPIITVYENDYYMGQML